MWLVLLRCSNVQNKFERLKFYFPSDLKKKMDKNRAGTEDFMNLPKFTHCQFDKNFNPVAGDEYLSRTRPSTTETKSIRISK